MNLDDFVSETLKQIIKGVVAAQEFGDSHNAKVNPITARFHSSTEGQAFCQETGVPLQHVAFEEQTSSGEESTIGSISVSPVSANTTQNSSVSRIKFDVPVLLPTTGEQVEY